MRVLFFYPYLPSPRTPHGSARLVSRLLADLADDARITLICAYRPHEREHVESVREICHRVVAVERPFRADLNGRQRLQETAAMAWGRLTTTLPLPVLKLRRRGLREAVKSTLADDFDLVHVEGSVLAQYVTLFRDLPAVLVDYEAAGEPGSEHARWSSYVRRTYPRFDRVFCMTPEDGDVLRGIAPGLEVDVRPPGIAVPANVRRSPEPDRVLFFGSAEHEPNRDALDWIARDILPRIRERRPSARLVCAGFPTVGLPGLVGARAAGVELLGFVEDLGREIDRASVVLSPIRLGRGIRIKNLETLARGAPLVTTSLGRRGLSELGADTLRVADSAEALADATCDLLDNPGAASSMGARGRTEVSARFTFARQSRMTLDAWTSLGLR